MTQNFDLLIFSKAPNAYEPNRILDEARVQGLSVETISYSDVNSIVKDDKIQINWKNDPMPKAKYVILRSAGGEGFYIPQRDFLIKWFEGQGAKVLNSKTYKLWSRLDKITQHFEFQMAGLPLIDTIVWGSNEKLIENTREFPLIIKKNLSSRGRDVFKVNNLSDIKEIFDNDYNSREMLLQPFLKLGEDLRIIVIGGEVIGAMKRTASEGKYLTNYSQGGSVENYDLEAHPEVREIAEKVAKHFELDYVGVDLMMSDEGGWKVLEVNRSCQFQGFEKATGINVPQKVLQFLLRQ